MPTYFLHGLDSSGRGTKGRFFAANHPQVTCPDFSGTLFERLQQFAAIGAGQNHLTLIGSSFGGLMATCFAIDQPHRISRLVLLAPALNFPEYTPPQRRLDIPTLLVIGLNDTVTPPDPVLPLARKTFFHLEEQIVDDDHMLHNTFGQLPWHLLIPAV